MMADYKEVFFYASEVLNVWFIVLYIALFGICSEIYEYIWGPERKDKYVF